jgi:hypothetical protein
MANTLDLVGTNSFVRKTDETLRVTLTNSDSSNFSAGSYVCYLTIRDQVPQTSITGDTDSTVIILKTVTVTLASPSATITCDFALTQTELDIDPKDYYYDVKINDPLSVTTSITTGYRIFRLVADITRRNT